MALNKELNIILKRMWALDEKLDEGESLTTEEADFYKENLQTIADYYSKNNEYWKSK